MPADSDPPASVPRSIALVEGESVIGRSAEAHIILPHAEVSRRHCLVRVSAGRVDVEDLGSRSGTLINGQRFDRAELVAGDRLRIGPFNFVFDGADLHLAGEGAPVLFHGVTVVMGGRRILDMVTCEIAPGAFAGILGPSGAGKSTLLKCAAGLLRPDSGAIDLGQSAASQGFVPQDDIVHPQLTPRQALMFSARLRLRRSLSGARVSQIASSTLELLRLDQQADVRIDRLSGGQRKRVSVAVELLARPSVLFLDEPTSGLDPAAELRLMEALRRLATAGTTVLCTTHIVENVFLMDKLIVLGHGRVAFCGSPDDARTHFGVQRFQEIYERLETEPEAALAAGIPEEKMHAPAPKPSASPPRQNTQRVGTALAVLLARMTALLAGDLRQMLLLVFQPLIIGLLLCWASNDAALILFFVGLSATWFGCNNAAEEIVKEAPVYLRERFAGVPRASYIASKILWMSGVTLLQVFILYGVCVIFQRPLPGDWRWQMAALGLAAVSGSTIGLAVSALAGSARQAILAVPLLLIPQILLSGFTIAAHELPPHVRCAASFLPSYATQQLLDTSFVWAKPLSRDVLKEFWTSFRNLNGRGDLKTGEIYRRPEPAVWGAAVHAAWICLALAGVWYGLGRRERQGE